MKKVAKQLCVSLSLFGAVAFSNAEVLYSIESSELTGRTLFDQNLVENSVVTIKPTLSTTATGDVEVLNQCLWSVKVDFLEGGQVGFAPGKMICVGPQQEVLESTPVGTIEAFGTCANACASLSVKGDVTISMSLEQPLQFSVQARNERQ